MILKIGILGSGIVGKTLSGGFIKHGHEVMAGSRTPEKIASWKKEIGGAMSTGTFSDAAKFGEIIVLATKGLAAAGALKLAGSDNLSGKIIIDTTNPIADAPPVNGVLRFFTDLDSSLMEQLQAEFPEARFVKAFNSIGNVRMVDPDFGDIKPTMPVCGNDPAAVKTVSAILESFGWEVADLGKAEAARAIEPLCILWCIPGFLQNSWSHAFKILK
jgi:predicted dinucleotide-binding enzyme